MKRLLFALIVIVFSLPFFTLGYTSPGVAQGFVNDFANVLSPGDEESLEAKLTQFEKETGNELAIVTIETKGEETIEEYAVKLFEEWKIGKAENDNGILVLVAVRDREMRIEVGYGLEGAIPDIVAGEIIRDILTPNFKNGDFYAGLNTASDAIISATRGEYASVAPAQSVDGFDMAQAVFIIIFFVLPWIGSVLARSKSWWGGGILGGLASFLVGLIFGTSLVLLAAIILVPLGLLFDYLVSKTYASRKAKGKSYPWWIGGGGMGGHGGFGSSGGFGGFGGGSSGGGGASGRW